MIQAFNQLRIIHKAFGVASEMLQEDIGKSLCVSCGQCCQVNTPRWMMIEAIMAVSILTGTGKLDNNVKLAEGWLTERHKEATLYEGMPIGWASPRLVEEFNSLSVTQCPFLVNNKCSIYEVRPITCRAFGVTRDNSETCRRAPGRGETQTQRRYINAPDMRKGIEDWVAECKAKNPTWTTSGFVPALLYRAAKPDKFKLLVDNNQVASAKITGVDYDTNLMWQPQVEAIRSGVNPELALMRR